MPYSPSTVRVWADIREASRCRHCRRFIVWVTSDKGKHLPFNLGFTVRETVRDERRCRFDVLSFDDIHRCDQRRTPAGDAATRLF